VASFGPAPKWVPQMAVSGEVAWVSGASERVRYGGLTRICAAYEGCRLPRRRVRIAVFAAASEGFSQKNIYYASIEEAFRAVFAPSSSKRATWTFRWRGLCLLAVVKCPFDEGG